MWDSHGVRDGLPPNYWVEERRAKEEKMRVMLAPFTCEDSIGLPVQKAEEERVNAIMNLIDVKRGHALIIGYHAVYQAARALGKQGDYVDSKQVKFVIIGDDSAEFVVDSSKAEVVGIVPSLAEALYKYGAVIMDREIHITPDVFDLITGGSL